MTMNDELPDDLRALDNELKQAMRSFAPPANLDAGIVAHVSRRSRLSIMPTSGMRRAASAVAAASLLATVGYVADRQMNGGRSSLLGDLERLVAFDTRFDSRSGGQADAVPSAYSMQDDIEYFPTGPEFKLSQEEDKLREGRESFFPKPVWESETDETSVVRGPESRFEWFRQAPTGLPEEPASTPTVTLYNGQQSFSSATSSQTQTLITKDGAGTIVQDGKKSKGNEFPTIEDRTKSQSTTDGVETEGKDNSGAAPIGGEEAAESFKPGHKPGQDATRRIVIQEETDGRLLEGSKRAKDGRRATDDPDTMPTSRVASGPAGPGGTKGQSDGKPAVFVAANQARPDGAAAPKQAPSVVVRQRVIRSGTVEFEVDSFDSALLTISKLVTESGGFVASTDSSKLPNGKTRGAVTVRVPPERLDALVLMLRGIGDLKSQKIAAQDVSKQYTDIESQLRAARAMEERLLDMIKKGNGAIKELLAAEKELGVWREKIEKFEGEIRYYDNLIGLSTLTVVMQERDIKASAASIETETVSAGVETDDVEKARAEILKAIDEAKGRIITSDLKKLDAGQFAATIVAEVAPDRSGPVIDRVKQLGKLARLEVDRKQTSVDGTAAPLPGAKVEQRPTRFTISLYNLANVAPRLTTTATLASCDVEAGYKEIMTFVEKEGGRIVTSQLQRPQADQVVANLQIEVPSAQAAATQAAITGLGEVMSLQLSENPDTANVTTAKQGFAVRIISSAGVAARETVTLQLASQDVVTAHRLLADMAAKVGARITQSNVTEGDGDNVNAVLQVDLPRTARAEWDQARADAGDVLTRSVVRSTDLQNTLDSKLRINLTLFPADRLPPRQVTTAAVVVRSSESQQQAFLAQATQLGGRVIDQTMSRDANGRSHARVVFDVPRDKAATIFDAIRAAGDIRMMNTTTNPQAPEGPLARTRFELQLGEGEALVGAENSLWSSIQAGLATSLKGLGYSLRLLVVAICLVAPWALVLWGGWRLMRRNSKPPVA